MSACSPRVKTCQTCATAKIRCLRSAGSAICDRCLRLNKPCYFRPSRLRQPWAKKESRLESLEKKVEELLGQSQDNQNSSHSPPNDSTRDVFDKGLITLDEAAALLDSYLQFMMPHFPYVVLPSRATVSELREHKPFLFLAILSVAATENRELQRALDDEAKAALAERTVLAYIPPSLETIQGILVMLAWSQHQVQQQYGPRNFSTLLYLAIGLLVELELDRPIELRRQYHRLNVHETTAAVPPIGTPRAEQRAVLGCSLLSSCFAIITQKKCTFPWSSYLEAFAVELAQSSEYASDQCLIHLIQLQHIFEQIDSVSADPTSLDTSSIARVGGIDPFQHTFRTFQRQLQDLSSKLSPQLTLDNFLLVSQLHTVNMYFCQVSLFDKQSTAHLSPGFRMEILCHGLDAAKRSYKSLSGLPLGTERYMSYTMWLQTGFNLILSCKLAAMAVSDEPLRRSEPRLQSLYDQLGMDRVLNGLVTRQRANQQAKGTYSTGFDYPGWLQWIHEWFNRQCNGVTTRGKNAGTTDLPGTAVPEHLGTTEVYNPGLELPATTSDPSILPWPPFPEMFAVDNPLYGWMDLGILPI